MNPPDLYFAYGSNLKIERLRRRVSSARALEAAHLPGRRLALNKRGRDGSGKANLVADPDTLVWGVLYEIEAVHWVDLDAFERGYERVCVEVATAAGASVAAQTYEARDLTDQPVAFDWYVRLIVEGAREHGLPADYVALLEDLPRR